MNPDRLYEAIEPYISNLMVDPLNYRNQVKDLFLKNHWEYELSDQYAAETRATLMLRWKKRGRHAEVKSADREK